MPSIRALLVAHTLAVGALWSAEPTEATPPSESAGAEIVAAPPPAQASETPSSAKIPPGSEDPEPPGPAVREETPHTTPAPTPAQDGEAPSSAGNSPADSQDVKPPPPVVRDEKWHTPPGQAVSPATQIVTAPTQAIADLSARLQLMEQYLLNQRDRDVAIYRDTSKLVTFFGLSFAIVGMLGLSAAAYINYRGMLAWQNAGVRSSQLVPGPSGAGDVDRDAVPGMERVQASRQRFQSRMSSLEARLSEMEHLSGLRPAMEVPAAPIGKPTAAQEEAGAPSRHRGPDAVVQRAIPLASILVQKAETLASLGKHAEALAVLDEAERTGEMPVDVRLTRSRVLERMGRISEALEVCDLALHEDKRSTGALLMKAGLLNRQERFVEALACYEQALTLHRESA